MEYTLPFISATPRQWAKVTHLSRSGIYEEIKAGTIEAVQDGNKTVITAEAMLRRLKSLPKIEPKKAADNAGAS